MKTTSRFAIAAVATALLGTAANAADLGGNCCADLEERIAELEATTVRKGNRKVSLTISGYVSHHVMFWDDGTQSDMYIGDGGNYGSRWRFTGSAKVTPQVTAGFLYEFAQNGNALGSMNQLNNGDDQGASGGSNCQQSGNSSGTVGCNIIRQSTVYLRHASLGMVRVGQGSTATDDLVLIDVGGLAGAATPDVGLYMGGFLLRDNAGNFGGSANNTWTPAIRGHESWDSNRRNHVLYETPSLAGFTVQAAVAEDNFWDVALRYAGEFAGFRIAAGIGYYEDTKFNKASQEFNQFGVLSSSHGDTKATDLKGSASAMHVPTGLFLTGAAGKRELSSTTNGVYNGPDLTFWWLSGGLSRNWFGIGNTVLYGEYGEHKGGLAQASFLGTTSNFDATADSKVTSYGAGIVQNINAAAMEVFLAYKAYQLDTNGFTGSSANLNSNAVGVHDIQSVIVGTRIQF